MDCEKPSPSAERSESLNPGTIARAAYPEERLTTGNTARPAFRPVCLPARIADRPELLVYVINENYY